MKKLSIDRIEGEFAICEDGNKKLYEISAKKLPIGLKEGDVIIVQENGNIIFDEEETRIRRQEVKNLLNNILNRR